MASDRTSQTGEATAGFVQRPTIPPRSRRVISHSPLEIAAEYRAIVMVWVSRSYLEKGNPDTYEVDYFSERSTIGKWRSEHIIHIDDYISKTALMAKQEKMSRLGFGFDVASVSDRINVRMLVPINQPDPRFGNGNENLTGSAVTTGRPLPHMRIVEDKLEIDHPLKQ